MIEIRDERPSDIAEIAQVIPQAFRGDEEVRLVERLRADGDATISLVAMGRGAIPGHVMLSPVAAPFRALGLAPLSVLPGHQRQGVGAALVRAAIARARDGGWLGIFVLGDPAYYARFGFRADLAAGFTSPYAGPHLMLLPLMKPLPAQGGRIDYAPAFAPLT